MMNEPSSLPSPAPVFELLEAFRRSKTMFTAVSLGVFDALAAGPVSLEELALRLACQPAGLQRLLDACVGLHLLARESPGYALTPVARTYLTQSSPQRMTGYINYSNAVVWKLWDHLDDAVREGTHRWRQTFGWDGPLFSHFFRDEAAKREFLMGMHGFGIISSPLVVRAFDLNSFQRFVDLGAATGHLTIAACQQYPALRGVVFDLAEAIPLAQEIVGASSVADRIEFVAGNFFTDPLPPGDLYALGRILHDWSDDKVSQLLARIWDALPHGGGLLIAEKLLWDDRSGPVWGQMQDLNMLTCTEGKERTLGEYRILLESAGFRQVEGAETLAPVDAILARKP